MLQPKHTKPENSVNNQNVLQLNLQEQSNQRSTTDELNFPTGICVVNTCFHTDDSTKENARLHLIQTKYLTRRIQRFNIYSTNSNLPIIICGSLNTGPGSYPPPNTTRPLLVVLSTCLQP